MKWTSSPIYTTSSLSLGLSIWCMVLGLAYSISQHDSLKAYYKLRMQTPPGFPLIIKEFMRQLGHSLGEKSYAIICKKCWYAQINCSNKKCKYYRQQAVSSCNLSFKWSLSAMLTQRLSIRHIVYIGTSLQDICKMHLSLVGRYSRISPLVIKIASSTFSIGTTLLNFFSIRSSPCSTTFHSRHFATPL